MWSGISAKPDRCMSPGEEFDSLTPEAVLLSAVADEDDRVSARVRVTGRSLTRRRHLVQCFVTRAVSDARVEPRLASSSIVDLRSGESATLNMHFALPATCRWDRSRGLWITEPGAVKVSLVVDGGPVLYESFVVLSGGVEHGRAADEPSATSLLATAS
jgi:hypothetical protein